LSTRTKTYMKPGQRVRYIGPYSEVMCHMKIAGHPYYVELIGVKMLNESIYHSARVYGLEQFDPSYGSPVTLGEAGIHQDEGGYYTYAEDGPGDDNPDALLAEARQLLHDAIVLSGVQVMTITNLGL
jgi:hypothetical protein